MCRCNKVVYNDDTLKQAVLITTIKHNLPKHYLPVPKNNNLFTAVNRILINNKKTQI